MHEIIHHTLVNVTTICNVVNKKKRISVCLCLAKRTDYNDFGAIT